MLGHSQVSELLSEWVSVPQIHLILAIHKHTHTQAPPVHFETKYNCRKNTGLKHASGLTRGTAITSNLCLRRTATAKYEVNTEYQL